MALPSILFFSALSSLLYYFGILQAVVRIMAWVLSRGMKLSGPESLSAAANVFVGKTEARLLVKPFVSKMSCSKFLALIIYPGNLYFLPPSHPVALPILCL
ncbi:MAG: nucleoside recognition domain-containing protein [Opitutales bacterium]|nr:nucleoside recognition domain-containing protein [Opitutales bacterium]